MKIRMTDSGKVVEVAPDVARHLVQTRYATQVAEEAVEPPAAPSDAMTVDELKAYAAEQQIDLGDATKKADILAAIEASA